MTNDSQPPLISAQGKVEIRIGDCRDLLAEMPDESVHCVVTSPPYNLGIDYSEYDDGGDRDAYLDWSMKWAGEVKRVLAEDGSFFLNVGASPRQPLLPHHNTAGP